jgi:predicted solute-binding protein
LCGKRWKNVQGQGRKRLGLKQIILGAPSYVSVRPLIFGLMRRPEPDSRLVYQEPGVLAAAVERGELDAALVPAVEYLRGVGKYYVDGPALIARPAMGSMILLATKPIEELERIAVSEYSRSPVAILRIVLGELYSTTPDLCVIKNGREDWCENYDGILLSGDTALRHLAERGEGNITAHNIADMWYSLTSLPAALALWVYNDESLGGQLAKLFITSRNFGIQNILHLADGIAQTTQYDGEMLYDYFVNSWEYNLSDEAVESLKVFEEHAKHYDLVRHGRFEHATTT